MKLWKKGDEPKDRTHIIQVRSAEPDKELNWKKQTAYLPIEAKGHTSETIKDKIIKALGLNGK